MNKTVLTFFTILCLLSTVFLMGLKVSVKGNLELPVHNIDTGVDYATIQEAINANETLNGHTIFVEEGIYYENVVINKTISLTGENRETTVIDGNGTGIVVHITKNSVDFNSFAVKNGGRETEDRGIFVDACTNVLICNCTIGTDWEAKAYRGISLDSSDSCRVTGNIVSETEIGILLDDSRDCWVVRNRASNNNFGIYLGDSENITLRDNTMTENHYNFGVWGLGLSDFIHDVDTSNIIDDKPIYYLVNLAELTINSFNYQKIGYLALVNSTNIVVEDLNLTSKNGQGVLFAGTRNSTIRNIHTSENYWGVDLRWGSDNCKVIANHVHNNEGHGIFVHYSDDCHISMNNASNNGATGIKVLFGNNSTLSYNSVYNDNEGLGLSSWNCTVIGNTISNNEIGISLASSHNTLYHNSLINNGEQVIIARELQNKWDSGTEGNYWSDYPGVDSDHDGIGDSPNIIDANNTDRCPLMGMFSNFNTSLGHHVNVISNSTIEDFEYFDFNNAIRMYVSNMTTGQTFGFCRVCVPHTLMNPEQISVIIDDGQTPILHHNFTLYDNGTHRWIYFAYEHSTHEIDIIPEFTLFLILPLFMITTLLPVVICRRKHTM